MFATFLAMGAIAKDVIKAFHADFYQHDARILSTMVPGDVALWKPREHGSNFIIAARKGIGNERARESLLAFMGTHGRDGWYVIAHDESRDEWELTPESDPSAYLAGIEVQTALHIGACIRKGIEPPIVRELYM